MRKIRTRVVALALLSSGTLLISTCEAVEQTIRLALGIVDVWV